MAQTIHNPDQYMSDLRQILAQGRKRLGLLLGAGAPGGVRVDKGTGHLNAAGVPLVPMITDLTKAVLEATKSSCGTVLDAIKTDIGGNPNIEMILSRLRALADAIGMSKVHETDGLGYTDIANLLCDEIGKAVSVSLPPSPNPFTELAGWVGGTPRDHAFEIFTTNYDLLLEEAFERAHIPYFDGFSGARQPFFDPPTIMNGDLPNRWARIWKLHGSLGWDKDAKSGDITRGHGNKATRLIFPTHLKYDQCQKLPYTALFDRLKAFLREPDSLLLTCGFSFSDPHLLAVIDESVAANRGAAVAAFQFRTIAEESTACWLAHRRANVSVYAEDEAVINCVKAPWRPGDLPHPAWGSIRTSYWASRSASSKPSFLLGDFTAFARYIALTRAEHAPDPATTTTVHAV